MCCAGEGREALSAFRACSAGMRQYTYAAGTWITATRPKRLN
jgi:hypothetical protein